jgi:hypothetical protein
LDDIRVLQYIEAPLVGDDFEDFIQALLPHFPKYTRVGDLYGSLAHLRGKPISQDTLSTEAWRLFANVHTLKAQQPVQPWTAQVKDEWVPLQVVNAVTMRARSNKVGCKFTFRVLAGSPATLLMTKFWTSKYCYYIADTLGFTKSYLTLPMEDPVELVGLRLFGKLTVALCSGTNLAFDEIRCSSTQETHNKDVTRKRRRVEWECPKGYKHECFQCKIGYDKCSVAIRPKTLVKRDCEHCRKRKLFEPTTPQIGMCVECQRKKNLEKKD